MGVYRLDWVFVSTGNFLGVGFCQAVISPFFGWSFEPVVVTNLRDVNLSGSVFGYRSRLKFDAKFVHSFRIPNVAKMFQSFWCSSGTPSLLVMIMSHSSGP